MAAAAAVVVEWNSSYHGILSSKMSGGSWSCTTKGMVLIPYECYFQA